jgi:hypothetical protein
MPPEFKNIAVSSLQKLKLADVSDCTTLPGRIAEVPDGEVSANTSPDPILEEARFCDWAFSKLGHVTVFGFAGGGFMLLSVDGERTRGESLALALQAMVELRGRSGRRLDYPVPACVDRAA